MPAFSGRTREIFDFLTADPQTVGVVTWVGLLVTVAGFWIAIAQLRKVKSSSQAATEAVSRLTKVVRSQEQNTKIISALRHLALAQAVMKQGNAEAAAAYLLGGWTALVAARELTSERSDWDLIGGFVLSTRQLLDDINAPATNRSNTAKAVAQRHAEISKLLDGLEILSARLNAALSGIGLRS